MPKEISLTQGQVTIVDDADFEWLNEYKWYYVIDRNTGYAVRSQWHQATKTRRRIQMAPAIMRRLLSQRSGKLLVDHINGDGLDNQRCNLRICTHRQNAMNRRKQGGCSSKYKGVTWVGHKGRWQAYIKVNDLSYHLGDFDDEKAAARAYDAAARKHFGEFARPNLEFPHES